MSSSAFDTNKAPFPRPTMQFSDIGILVQITPHGEGDIVARVFTREHGLHAGLIKGGNSRRYRGILEVGGRYEVTWQARLADNLGTFSLEPSGPMPSVQIMDDPNRLLGLQALSQILATSLTERDPVLPLFDAVTTWLDQLTEELWVHTLALIELRLLGILGFGLDLSRCASTGTTEELCYVSPRSGRAVSAAAGVPYHDRLLTLPRYLIGEAADDFDQDAINALILTGRFLSDRVYGAQNQDLPWSRKALIERLSAQQQG